MITEDQLEQLCLDWFCAQGYATLRDTLLPKLLSGELVVGSPEGASAMETAM
jgi:hypothetical protein